MTLYTFAARYPGIIQFFASAPHIEVDRDVRHPPLATRRRGIECHKDGNAVPGQEKKFMVLFSEHGWKPLHGTSCEKSLARKVGVEGFERFITARLRTPSRLGMMIERTTLGGLELF